MLIVRGEGDEMLHRGLWRVCRSGFELSIEYFSFLNLTIEQKLAIAMTNS